MAEEATPIELTEEELAQLEPVFVEKQDEIEEEA